MPQKAKKLVMVLAISILIIEKKTEEKLEEVFYIWYFIIFKDSIKALLDLKSKVNLIS